MTHEDIARASYEAWNKRDMKGAVAHLAADARLEVVGTGETHTGPNQFRRYNEAWAEGFPDGTITIERIADAGDVCVVEFTGHGTHTGTLVTSMGDIPPTGRSVVLKLCDVLEFRGDQVIEQRTYFDTGSMMAQLGLFDPQAATQAR